MNETPTGFDVAGAQAGVPIRYNDLGQPVLRVRKDLLAAGTYTPPTRAWTLRVDTDRLHKLARRFAEMRAGGVNVPVIATDAQGRHNWHPDNARGYLRDVAIDGQRLIGDIELIGQDAVNLAGRTEVSVGIHPDFRDGKGKEYGEAIDHVAICLNPVVPDQQGWRIAASRAGSGGAGATREDNDRDELFLSAPMETQAMNGPTDFLKELSTYLGEPLTPDNWLDCLKRRMGKSADELRRRADEHEAAMNMSRAELSTAHAKVRELEGRLATLPKMEMSREAQAEALETIGERLNLLVERARITPVVGTKLGQIFRSGGALVLSRGEGGEGGGNGRSLARQVLDVLADNDPVRLGEQTRGQAVALARQVPDDTAGADEQAGAEFVKQQLVAAGVIAGKKTEGKPLTPGV